MQTLGAMLETTARWFPDKPLIIFNEDVLTYGAFNRRAARLAGLLQSLGVGPGTPVGLYLPSCPDIAVGYHACQKIGAIAVPMSAAYTPHEVERLGQRTRMPVLICRKASFAMAAAAQASVPELKHILVVDGDVGAGGIALESALDAFPDTFAPVPADPEAVAAIFFTSGTTGLPKGAMQSHRSIFHALRDTHVQHRLKWTGERLMCALPLFNNFGATVMLNGCIQGAGTLILIERWDSEAILTLMGRHGATYFAGTPTMFSYLLDAYDPARHHLGDLRLCASGGGPFPPDVLARFEATFSVPVLNGYGASELCGFCTSEAPVGRRKAGSVGGALGNSTITILDDAGNRLPAGEPGEICVSGDVVGAGYWQDPEATAAAFTPSGWRSGDIGRLDEDGVLYILDRKKDVIITSGSNIFPAEIEAVLSAHPAVSLAAVVGVPDALKGELAIGCIVKRSGAEVSEETLIAFCRERLSSYKVPRRIAFFDEFELGPTGKILKKAILVRLREHGSLDRGPAAAERSRAS